MIVQIPMTNQPNRSFTVTIPQGDNNIRLTFFSVWNEIAGYWQLSITNNNTGELLIESFPMVTNEFPYMNFLRQFGYFEIGEAAIQALNDDAANYPQINDWETNFRLLWSN